MNYLYNLDEPLLDLSGKKEDLWTIGDAVQGSFIVGGTGLGKSSGSGRAIAHSFLKAGFGGVILCAKENEADTWRKYAKETGRENSLIVFDGSGNFRFNFLDYEINREGGTDDKTALALDVFTKILEAINSYDGKEGGGKENPYWENTVRMLLLNCIDILFFVYGRLKISELLEFIRGMPATSEEFNKTFASITSNQALESLNFHYKTLLKASDKISIMSDLEPSKIQFNKNLDYLGNYYDLEKKTKSILWSLLESTMLDFSRGDIERLFCTDTNIKPEYADLGAIIVLDFPTEIWQRGGYLAQYIFKYAFQRYIKRRKIKETTRPCFLWIDEAQMFVSSYDALFLSTVRSSKCATVYLTQSIPAIRTKMKGDEKQDAADELLNNFQTRIIHTCFDSTTQDWAASSIGKALIGRWSENFNENENSNQAHGTVTNQSNQEGLGGYEGGNAYQFGIGRGKQSNHAKGEGRGRGIQLNHIVDYELLPSFFARNLKMGGKKNNYLVDAVLIRAGRVWDFSNKTYLVCSFKQRG